VDKQSISNRIGQASGALRWLKGVRAFSETEIVKEADRMFLLAVIGDEQSADRMIQRLSQESGSTVANPAPYTDIRTYVGVFAKREDAPSGAIVLHVGNLLEDEHAFNAVIAKIVAEHPVVRLALARRIPAFRATVAGVLTSEVSLKNAKVAVVSALPGVVPMLDVFLPATALGDMAILTRNQAELILRIAAAYGLPINLKARMKELLPVVGSAFGWRAVARELIGMVPGGVGVVAKGAVAYAGTYSVGKAATIYYSTGQQISPAKLKQLYADAYKVALSHAPQFLKRGKAKGKSIEGQTGDVKLLPSGPSVASS